MFEASLRHSGHLDVRRTGINHSSKAATKRQIRVAWLKARTKERLKRASRAGKKTLGTFQTWRRSGLLETKQRQRRATTHQRQVSRRSCAARATSTEIDDEDGSRKPRNVVWITHAGTLIKCAPEQLRYSSERARLLANMGSTRRRQDR